MILIVLASGRGTRLGNLTINSPKCLVKINRKPIISYTRKIFNKFEKVFIITGYQQEKIKNYLKDHGNCKFFFNKKFKTTNMVESMFVPFSDVNKDIIVVYSDIIFDPTIIDDLRKQIDSSVTINSEWLKYWKKRMKMKDILNDAENLVLKNGKIKTIGTIIKGTLPKYQFMGIVKIKLLDYKKLFKAYKEHEDKNIDLTNFLNHSINKKNIDIRYLKTNKFWVEVDNKKDVDLVKKLLKK